MREDIKRASKYKVVFKQDVNINVEDLRDGPKEISIKEFCKVLTGA